MGDNPLLLIKEKRRKERIKNPSRGGIVDAVEANYTNFFLPLPLSFFFPHVSRTLIKITKSCCAASVCASVYEKKKERRNGEKKERLK